MQYSHNPYLGAIPPELGQDDGDVSLAGPVILLLGLMGIGAALLFFKNRERNRQYDDNRRAEPAIKRLRNVIADIESDDDDDDENFDSSEEDFEVDDLED